MPFKDGLISITDQEEERIGNQQGKLMAEKKVNFSFRSSIYMHVTFTVNMLPY